jgi:hypothetical protein
MPSHLALCWDLATTGAIEDNPHGEVLGKVLETMLGSRSHEQKVACLEWVPLAIVKEDTSAADDDVDLVLCVRNLLVRGHREGEFYIKGAALQKADGVLARGARDTRLSLSNTDHTATIWLTHASFLVTARPYDLHCVQISKSADLRNDCAKQEDF